MRTSALTDVGNGWWEVELYGPTDCRYSRHVRSIEMATAPIQWWHSDYPVAA